jgi:hypothetical protein
MSHLANKNGIVIMEYNSSFQRFWMKILPAVSKYAHKKITFIFFMMLVTHKNYIFLLTDSSSGREKKFIKLNSYGFIAKYYCYYYYFTFYIDDFLQKKKKTFYVPFSIHTTQIIHFHRKSCLKCGICLYVCIVKRKKVIVNQNEK